MVSYHETSTEFALEGKFVIQYFTFSFSSRINNMSRYTGKKFG